MHGCLSKPDRVYTEVSGWTRGKSKPSILPMNHQRTSTELRYNELPEVDGCVQK